MIKNYSGRRIFSVVILATCFIKLIVLWVSYVQLEYNLSNPLIPRSLVQWKFDYSLALAAVYVPIIALNVFYLLKQKWFVFSAIISVIGIVTIQLFWFQIEQYFLPN